MKQISLSILLVAAMSCLLAACSGKDYMANPSTNANQSVNPLRPLTSSEFTWVGNAPMSANIGGNQMTLDTAWYYWSDTTGNVIFGKKGKVILALYLKDVWAGNVYTLPYKDYNRYGMYADSVKIDTAVVYVPYYSALGNSGEVKILQNDTAHIAGQFYFQAVGAAGKVVNINNGYFNILKYP